MKIHILSNDLGSEDENYRSEDKKFLWEGGIATPKNMTKSYEKLDTWHKYGEHII